MLSLHLKIHILLHWTMNPRKDTVNLMGLAIEWHRQIKCVKS